MELLQLKYFQTVARLQHMTKSAEELRITQPALSKMISTLEKDLDTKLFDRESKFIRLNDQGKLFLKYVTTALNALEDGKVALQDVSENSTNAVNLYVEVASHLLPDLLASFRQHYPGIHFNLLQHAAGHVHQPSYDLCLSTSLSMNPSTDNLTLLTEEILLAVPAGHPLADRSSVKLAELSEEAFLSLSAGKTLRETTDLLCKQAGFLPNIIFESDDPATVRGLIKAGLGVAFIPAVTWGGSTGASVVLLPIEEPLSTRTIKLYWPADRYLKKAAVLFREFTVDYFAKLTQAGGGIR
ncbi:LysR family transcriptional regulator [Paenibacillus prosopidis]|uniref:DNA-binding transcriptional LysR family regulator n=1 Tax=Paenibacillus prosopidis TaxID=630520 RepID=A0A368WCK7_9BACL|nr:LysR family transcriptional regulator [Paenibacillus prosopidis]RCW51867.1 DNA-binding transcriptional LysR family regulator [Paenibacillus prosopidis]